MIDSELNTKLSTDLAGLPRRIGALIYDAILLLALIVVVTIVIMLARGWREIDSQTWWFQLVIVLVCGFFYCWFWVHGGQTLGMVAWHIQVQRRDGSALRWRDAVTRVVAAWLAGAPAGLGYWWSLIDCEQLCWHDRLSQTRVIRKMKPKR